MGAMKSYYIDLTYDLMRLYDNTPRFYVGYETMLYEYYDLYVNNDEGDDFDYAVYNSIFYDLMTEQGLKVAINNLATINAKLWQSNNTIDEHKKISQLKNELKGLLKSMEVRIYG